MEERVINEPLFRYYAINDCLRNTARRWTRKTLHEAINRKLVNKYGEGSEITINVIDRDLQAMFEFGAPIERKPNGRGQIIFYDEPDYCFRTALDNADRDLIRHTIIITRHLKGFPGLQKLPMITKKLGIRSMSSLLSNKDIIEFDDASDVEGQEHLEFLLRAIEEERPLSILYQKFEEPVPSARDVHPYYLKYYDHLWYLLTYNETSSRYAVFALDRMKQITYKEIPYRDCELENRKDYFKDIMGVWIPEGAPLEDIELIFTADRGRYLKKKKLHHSQQTKTLPSGCLQVNYRLKINHEFRNFLLGFGKDVQIMKPVSLEEEMNKKTKDVLNSRE
jgi:hypothetical protein